MILDSSDFDSVIFDLGGVLLNLDIRLTLRAFQEWIPDMTPEGFLGQREQLPFLNEYETGRIDTEALITRFSEHFLGPAAPRVDRERFRKSWNAMALDLPVDRVQLLERLRAAGKRVFLLSNINALHEALVEDRFRELGRKGVFADCFDGLYYSHRIGLRKPDREAFERVIEEQRLQPRRTLFIDDTLQHVEGARSVGLQALHLRAPATVLDFFDI
jgi:FMN phosphatase YigB (HAD superfamily)